MTESLLGLVIMIICCLTFAGATLALVVIIREFDRFDFLVNFAVLLVMLSVFVFSGIVTFLLFTKLYLAS